MSNRLLPGFLKMTKDTYFGTVTSLNRFSFLRSNKAFVNATLDITNHPHIPTRLVFFKQNDSSSALNPLVYEDPQDNRLSLTILQLAKSSPLIQSKVLQWCEKNDAQADDIRDDGGLTMVFLGLDEFGTSDNFLASTNSLAADFKLLDLTNGNEEIETEFEYENYKGIPYFAIDITNSPEIETELKENIEHANNRYILPEKVTMAELLKLSNNEASLFSYSKSYLDWLMRNKFCPGCGSKVIPVDAGSRLLCTSEVEHECIIKKTPVNNVCFPRTDPVIIVGIVSRDKSKILLGFNKRHAKNLPPHSKPMYSCIAGFMEPGETIEEATIREIWEETGVKADDVKILKSQPWPFPASLMIGCIGIVDFNNENEKIYLKHDKELQDCQWFDVDEITKITKIDSLEHPVLDLKLPMRESIAFQLINQVVNLDY